MQKIWKNRSYRIDKCGTGHDQTKSRIKAFSQLSGQKASFPGWPAAVMGSALALGLVAASSAWAAAPALPAKQPSLSLSAPTYLTEVLPPFLPPELRSLVQEKSFPAGNEILFIDQGVADYQGLLDSMARNIEVVFLAPDRDGVAAIAEHLQGRTNLQGIHIVSHGGPGRLSLGNMTLTAEDLTRRQQDIALWSKALGPKGDVLLYGCDVAKGVEGIRFVNRLSHILTAGISASDDPTGSPALGGDWAFEYNRNVETDTIFTGSVSRNFHALLAPGQIIAGDGSGGGGGGGLGSKYNTGSTITLGTFGGAGGNGGGGDSTLIGTDGNDVIFGDGSGGGGGGGGAGFAKYAAGIGGAGGTGGSGADVISGGSGNDIIFGDGNNGFAGSDGSSYASSCGNPGTGGAGGFGNINAGTGGLGGACVDWTLVDPYGSSLPETGSPGSPGFGGASGGLGAGILTFSGLISYGQPGDDGSTDSVIQADTGGAVHAAAMAKIVSGYFDTNLGGNGNDELDGGPGSDVLLGMGGTNTFVFEVNDATSGSDVDTIYGWNDGSANLIDLRIGGSTFDLTQVDAVVASQEGAGVGDRSLVFRDACNQVTIVVKNIDRDLTSADFVIGPGAVVSPPRSCFPWNMFMPAIIIGGQKP
jgi:hypothetical protein